MNRITGKTRICGIIGDPVEHSMSPVMHNAAFEALELDYVYLPFHVQSEKLEAAISGMRALNISGLNVTIPHKVAVIPFLDNIDPLAERMGAVNTIANENGELTGYNTDASGFLQALRAQGVEPDGKTIIIVGAGGAAKGISFILAGAGASLVILNRTLSRAEELASQIERYYQRKVAAMTLNEATLEKAFDGADVIVNTTSVGMIPDIDRTPVPGNLLDSRLVVSDIVYNPLETRLLREARAAGARTVDGLDMLVWQGVLAFEKWTGQKAPYEVMKQAALKALKK
jgi:shikimate dehydrogenase